jgi:hypothetical protein
MKLKKKLNLKIKKKSQKFWGQKKNFDISLFIITIKYQNLLVYFNGYIKVRMRIIYEHP